MDKQSPQSPNMFPGHTPTFIEILHTLINYMPDFLPTGSGRRQATLELFLPLDTGLYIKTTIR